MSQPIDTAQISAFGGQVSKSVVFAIQDASRKSGVEFSYLVKQAAVESSFDPNAKARTSSATGLYQFIQSTWLDMVEKHGEKYGIDVNAPRKELLALRKDPELSSYMAAELANENEASLQANWGGEVGETELYLAHFMGAGGASAFLKANDRNPGMAAADLFPDAARSNRSVFFEGHRARSVAEVYNLFDQKFERYDAGMDQLMAAIDQPAAQQPVQVAEIIPQPQETPIILPANSVVFSMRPQYGAYDAEARMAGTSPRASMVMNPVEVMMLSQLDMPLEDKARSFF